MQERIAGLLVVGFRGKRLAPDHWILRSLAEDKLGGVILFARNIVSPDQLSQLTGTLREAAGQRPLLIAVDQEGGTVTRLGPANGFPPMPSAASIGGTGDPQQARRTGAEAGALLAAHGINLDLAPVVDVNVNPNNPSIGALGRSYSAEPEVVIQMAGAFVAGLHENGVLATLKHFPGLGSATGDTDREFVDLTETWSRDELEPFARLIGDGVPDIVMVANSLNGRLDARRPASLSGPTLHVLRAELGWDRPVITDDLQAGALRSAYGDDEIVRLALAAGNDLLLFANTQIYVPDIVRRTVDSVVGLVESGVLAEAQVDASVARVSRLPAG